MIEFFSADSWLNILIEHVSDFLWTYILLGVLLACGLWFTIRTHGVQFTMIGEMFRLIGDRPDPRKATKQTISSFQAFAVSLATRIGTGNLAGVAIAIAVGGPGAVFWMWALALIAAALAFVESTLAQLYKRRDGNSFIGGPAYYMLYGMHNKALATTFAVLITITFGLSYNSIQSNTICFAMNNAFSLDPFWVGLAIAALALLIVFGGIRRIARVSSVMVPLMAVGYFVLTLVIIVVNIEQIPHIFRLIVSSAFGLEEFTGGAIGTTILLGMKRGLFSNEAGEGSAPNVAATAMVSHPVKQGLIQTLGVFTDTLLLCSCTAFIILLSGLYNTTESNGIILTQNALNSEIGSTGTIFVAIAVFFFAFSSIIGNYYYGEANIRFLTKSRTTLTVFRICSAGIMVVFGAVGSLEIVWNIGDVCMGLLTACNLVAILALGGLAFKLLRDYRSQKEKGIIEPEFKSRMLSKRVAEDIECWD